MDAEELQLRMVNELRKPDGSADIIIALGKALERLDSDTETKFLQERRRQQEQTRRENDRGKLAQI